MKNRLKLDWTLSTAEDRSNFLASYLDGLPFEPTFDELETCANYALWGKDENGQNSSQNGEILLEGKSKTWTREKPVESLDALLESPTFNEASFAPQTEARTKIRREVFSRSDALEKAPSYLKETLQGLFDEIDELDLEICFYDLAHGKRQNPPRKELLERFSEEKQAELRQRAAKWNQFLYLKKRHLLVELRREQFTLRDSFYVSIQRKAPPEPVEVEPQQKLGSDISVLPLGIFDDSVLSASIFRQKQDLNPTNYSEDELKKISDFLWKKKPKQQDENFFDFRELEHVYNLVLQLDELSAAPNENTNQFIRTLEYYVEFAELSEIQQEILDFKIRKIKNQDIAAFVNQKYGKSYTANYISTIFRQKIIPKINDAAKLHQRIIESLFFEEDFKKCSTCGTWYLRDAEFFVRKVRAKDGLANRCKCCDKADRQLKKKGGK